MVRLVQRWDDSDMGGGLLTPSEAQLVSITRKRRCVGDYGLCICRGEVYGCGRCRDSGLDIDVDVWTEITWEIPDERD